MEITREGYYKAEYSRKDTETTDYKQFNPIGDQADSEGLEKPQSTLEKTSYTMSLLNYAFSGYEKATTLEFISKVALGTILVTPGLGLVVITPLLLLDCCISIAEKILGSVNEFDQFPSEETGIDYEVGLRSDPSRKGLGSRSVSYINNRTIMRGATRNWDPDRIKNGKLKQFKEMRAESIRLNSPKGNSLHACYFSAANFDQEIAKMGGKIQDITFDHPFLKGTQPVTLTKEGEEELCSGVRISYEAAEDEGFQAFCEEMKYTILRDNSSEEESYILIPKAHSLAEETSLEGWTIEEATVYDGTFEIFNPQYLQGKAIVFNDPGKIDPDNFILKESQLQQVTYRGETFMCDAGLASVLGRFNRKCKGDYEFLQIQKNDPDREAMHNKAVVLTTHQTGTFTATSPEIIRFLILGVNVLAYDNAGKGLSSGRNTKGRMTDAIWRAGEFLKRNKNIQESDLIFKGVCAGGLPTSEATKLFPKSTVWVDQSPENIKDATARLIQRELPAASKKAVQRELHLDENAKRARTAARLTSLFANFHVARNLKEKRPGHSIYTIGTEDYLVSKASSGRIRSALEQNPNGHFVSLPDGGHLAPWWNWGDRAMEIEGILRRSDHCSQ